MAKRSWTVRADPETGVLDRDEVIRALVDAEAMGHRFGGVFQAIPIREPVRAPGALPDERETTGWILNWDSFAPTAAPVEVEAEASDAAAGPE